MPDPTHPDRAALYRAVFAALCELGGDLDALLVEYDDADGNPRRRATDLALGLDALSTLACTDARTDDDIDYIATMIDCAWDDVVNDVNDRTNTGAP